MSTIMVNARVPVPDKAAADKVLATSRWTWSQAIQALAAYMRRTGALPEALTQPREDDDAEQQRKWDELWSLAGMVSSPELITDEDDDRLLYEAMMERYGY
ncbi:MAG: hypothetical protein LBI33_04240 [Propionibacteriaceae bacterium]|jgi:antitoxin component of RelBE/YafQ-DinJ toxin-antitoxin module|nr:hypothetical protein [Propionibacteriaceae bacterium]